VTIFMVCEGPADGLDSRVLRLLLVEKHNKNVQIAPAGGDTSLPGVARFLEERSRLRGGRPPDVAFSVADRNYVSLEQVEMNWRDPHARHLFWRRHEIENYLLQPQAIAEMFRDWQAAQIQGSADLPTAESDVWALLRQLAAPMLEDHAGRLTLYVLVSEQRRLDTRWLEPNHHTLPLLPGQVYADRHAWLTYLRAESGRLRLACRGLDSDSTFDLYAVEQRYDATLAQVTIPAFLTGGGFLSEMGGHELLWGLWNAIHERGISLALNGLTGELLNALDRIYQPGLFVPDDFQELAARLH